MSTLRSIAANPRVRRAVLASSQADELASRYIAAPDLPGAIQVARTQNGHGLGTVLLPIGNQGPDAEGVAASTTAYLSVIDSLVDKQANEVAVSPQLLGITSGINSARPQVRKIVRRAEESGVRLVLEMGRDVDATIQLFRELLPEAPTLAITLQAGLPRTMDDCRRLAALGARIRLCKGEGLSSGYRSSQDIAISYVRCLRVLMESPAYPIVATHDRRLIPIAQELAERTERTPTDYEFQMRYGFRPIEQRRLVDTGYQCRVVLPYGEDWYDYLSIGMAAHPQVWFRSLWARR